MKISLWLKITTLMTFLLLSALMFTGCKESKENIIGNSNPDSISSDERMIHSILGMQEDSSYEEISVVSSKKIYTADDETVSCVVANKNIGMGFYYYEIPYIEYNSDGEWIRLYYNSDRLEYAQWFFCGLGDNKESSCTLTIELSKVEPDIVAGNYRFVIFTAENTLYAEFEIQ